VSGIVTEMGKLSSAEEFLDLLGVDYDQRVVNVNRLHILKRFNQYMARHVFTGSGEEELRTEYRALLQRAYRDFVSSDAVTEKVFKVFQDAAGVRTFSMDDMRDSMRERKSARTGNGPA
jgi:nitrogenase-stabilizing/protective protein